MKRGDGPPSTNQRVEGVASSPGIKHEQFDVGFPSMSRHFLCNSHALIGSRTDDEHLRHLVERRPQVAEVKPVAVFAAPVGEHSIGEQDEVLGVGFAVHYDLTDLVAVYQVLGLQDVLHDEVAH